ncbi:MAG: ferredoxin [Gammaproteobacteria bacterium]
MQVNVDPDLCQGHTLCAKVAPGIFVLDPATRVSRCTLAQFTEEQKALVRKARGACPERAITVQE